MFNQFKRVPLMHAYQASNQANIQRIQPFVPDPIDSIKTSAQGMPIMNIYQKIPGHRLLSTLRSISQNTGSAMRVWTNPNNEQRLQNTHERDTVHIMRSILQSVSGGNVVTFLSAMLSESEQIQLYKLRPIIKSVHDFIENDDANKGQNVVCIVPEERTRS